MSNQVRYTSAHAGLGFRVGESSTAQESVLDLLMDGAGAEFTESQVREELGLPRSSTQRALKELVDEGMVGVRAVGRTLVYRVDPGDPLIRHLKIARAIALARRALVPVSDAIDLAVLFGSASRGDDTRESDVDLLVVTADPKRVLGELSRQERLQPLVLTPSQHMELIAEGGTLSRAVADGIKVAGSR
jgi:predicted nucleotidyltransferase